MRPAKSPPSPSIRGGQHAAHAVSQQEDPVRVDAAVAAQKPGRQQGVVDDLLPDGDGVLFVQDHFQAVGAAALVVADGGDAPGRQTLGNILERCQFPDFFVHIAGSGAVNQHQGREGTVSRREGQQALEGIAGVLSKDDGFLNHLTASLSCS